MDIVFSDNTEPLKPSAIREIFKSLTDPEVISFAAGNPSPESFPVEAMKRFADDIFERSPSLALQYGITEGYTPLRKAVKARASARFGAAGKDDTVIITTGGQQGIDLTAKVLCNRGDTVICEEPTFIGALNAFRAHGCRTVGVPMDDDGIDTDALEYAIKNSVNPKLIYLIPTFQNPTGRTMSYEKRVKCLQLAKKYGLLILEDDPYGELRFSGTPVPPIKNMDGEGRVIYCSSFSKILSSGMRVGYVICGENIAAKIAVCKQVNDVHTNMFFQLICHKFLTEYDLDAHIEKIRALYRKKASLMLKCLDGSMPDCVKYTRPDGGLFIWADLPENVNIKGFFKDLAEKRKLAVVPGATFMCDPDKETRGFRMNYSTPSDEQIMRGVRILTDALKELL